mmetsp:Transcript_8227/g.16201  ORF Transcript_8227/g.16201 Transcript_8227/m.16201 type:complete len:442 (+) Transcript_8227:4902-6227(+)
MREVISIHIGNAGVCEGTSTWELMFADHSITPDAKVNGREDPDSDSEFRAFFSENDDCKCVPRSVFIDCEPNSIDSLRAYPYSKLHNPHQMLELDGGSCVTFARGHRQSIRHKDKYLDSIRKEAEIAEDLDGFMIYHSIGGGTGSGLTDSLLEEISSEYGKKAKLSFSIFPFTRLAKSPIETYNSLLSIHSLQQYVDAVLTIENEALYNLCNWHFSIKCVDASELNGIVAHSSVYCTAPMRFNYETITQFCGGLVPSPHAKFLVSSIAPIFSIEKSCGSQATLQEIVDYSFRGSSMLARVAAGGKLISFSSTFREITPKSLGGYLNDKLRDKKGDCSFGSFQSKFVWGYQPVLRNGMFGREPRTAGMFFNDTSIRHVLNQVGEKFDRLHSTRAFMHWFSVDGWSEASFSEARETLEQAKDVYKECEDYLSSDEIGAPRESL